MKGYFRKRPVVVQAERIPVGADPVIIQTREGEMLGHPGDWIITGVEGERYPCADSIFRKTYEPAPRAEPAPSERRSEHDVIVRAMIGH